MLSQPITTSQVLPADPPEYHLRVTGAVRLMMVINLGSFVAAADADVFRHMRGSEAFATALRELHPRPPFLASSEMAQLEDDAYRLRIFRSRLRYNHFFPTYRVAWDSSMRARLLALGGDTERWQRWTVHIRLTRNGLAVITLEQALERMPLLRCAEEVLELPSDGHQAPQDQWSLGMTILSAFLDALDRQMALHLPDGKRVVHFGDSASIKHTLRLDRYVIYTFRRIERDGVLLNPHELKHEYAQTLASFMEGALVECDHTRRFPRYDATQASELVARDVASWEEELCLFTGESALLYYPLIGRGLAYVGGPMGLDAHAYSTYWAGVVRGIEHLVAFRAEVQQAERRTTDLLSRIPSLTRSVNDGNLSAKDIALIEHLAAGLSDIFDSLPEQRSMAVSTSAFRADYVRRKFETLLRELHVRETLNLVNTNVEQLNFFLSYYNDMRLQWEGQRSNGLGIALAGVVLFMAVSSFLADTFNVLDRLYSAEQTERDLAVRNLVLAIVIGLVTAVLVTLVVRWARQRWVSRRFTRH